MTASTRLISCPVCSGRPEVHIDEIDDYTIVWIQCLRCQIRIDDKARVADAYAAWNKLAKWRQKTEAPAVVASDGVAK